jgi:hypothetical protein
MTRLFIAALMLGTLCCSRRAAPPVPSSGDAGVGAAPLETIRQVPAGDMVQAFEVAAGAFHKLPGDPVGAGRDFESLGAFCVGEAGLAYLAWQQGNMDRAADHTFTLALTQWLEAEPWAAFYMEGGP